MRLKIDWASLIVGSKFIVFALFYFVFEGNFPSTSPLGLIFGGEIERRVFCVTGLGGLYMEGLIFGILRYFGLSRTWTRGISGNQYYMTKHESSYPQIVYYIARERFMVTSSNCKVKIARFYEFIFTLG